MNIRDAESAYQEGRVTFLEFERDFLKVWYEPLYRAQMAAFMASMSPEDMLTPGMEIVAPVIEQMLGGSNASTSTESQKVSVPWTGDQNQNRNRPAPTDQGGSLPNMAE